MFQSIEIERLSRELEAEREQRRELGKISVSRGGSEGIYREMKEKIGSLEVEKQKYCEEN